MDKTAKLKLLEQAIALKLKEKNFDEADRLSRQMVQFAEGSIDDVLIEPRRAHASSSGKSDIERIESRLNMLSIIHYVFSVFIGVPVIIALVMLSFLFLLPGSEINTFVGWITLLIIAVPGLLSCYANFYLARCLRARRRRVLINVISVLNFVVSFPFGIILGIVTLFNINSASGKAFFHHREDPFALPDWKV